MRSKNLIHRLILIAAILALLIPIAWIEHSILIQTRGTIAYPLDDAFINLTLAKNFAFDHVWGITKYSFASVSPSLLYPFVLALIYLVSGPSLFVPLLVNLAAAIWFLAALQRWLIRQNINPAGQLLILLAVIFLTPLPPLVMSGMEYTLELLFTFLFLAEFMNKPLTGKTYLYAVLMLTSSYQTLPLILIACIVLLVRKDWWEAVKLLFISVLPLYLFGLLSITKHNYFVPTPLLLTWGFPSLTVNPYYLGFVIGCAVALGGAWILKSRRNRRWYPIPALLILALIFHSALNFRQIGRDCIFAYTGQYQPAEFIYDYYYGNPVASNDLGAISFCSEDSRIIDLAGLSNLEVLERKRLHNWTPASADSLSERMNANVAILHHSWSDAEVEPYWYRIATWQTPTDSVSFYSIDKRYVERLQNTMRAFEPKLPPGVIVHYFPLIDPQ
ncbi:MAG TPA: hypothetical protein VG052_16340 [Puia sp.]|jgi:hypothetical protein|nr:hypothetical protein [Puia sp.]